MSKNLSRVIIGCLVMFGEPLSASAAGTYYTGAGYQPSQYRYGQTGTYATSVGAARGTTNSMASIRNPGYTQANSNVRYQVSNSEPQQRQTVQQKSSSRSGFYANAGVTHESAMWRFEMNTADSILHFDNLAWNVFDLSGGYIFDLGSMKMQFDAGVKYGIQWGESTMVDDDISNGGYGIAEYWNGNNLVGAVLGHGLSIGTSQDSSQFGLHVGFGLTDFMKIGNIKITPSIGYRYMKTSLQTKNNYGMLMDSVLGGCDTADDESQCGVALMFFSSAEGGVPSAILPANGMVQVPAGTGYVNASDTYYYEQLGTSHSYDVEWSGPYIALDMLYDINQNNTVNGRIELGFPGYTATGDQPYRWDWAHPKSVQDTANMFAAFHIGLAANWQTALTDAIALSLGVTYDYYTISNADTETYLNQSLYNSLLAKDPGDRTTSDVWVMGQLEAKRDACDGWVCKANKEIDSFYKSMGVRVGLTATF